MEQKPAVAAPPVQASTAQQIMPAPVLVAPGWQVVNEKKIVNVELPSGQFLELKVPIIKYVPRRETRIQATDISRLTTLTNDLSAYLALPTTEQIQPAQLARLSDIRRGLRELQGDFSSRIDPEVLPDAK